MMSIFVKKEHRKWWPSCKDLRRLLKVIWKIKLIKICCSRNSANCMMKTWKRFMREPRDWRRGRKWRY